MSNAVPEGWAEFRQGDVTNFSNGRAYKLDEWESHGTPVIRLQNLTGSGKDYYYSNLELPDRQYCEYGDLLFMWSATFGPHIWKGPKAIYHYHIWKVTPNEVNFTKAYAYQLLGYKTIEWLNKSNGMGILHVTKGGMEDMPLTLPPLPEQQKIATILSSVDNVIETTRAQIDKLKDLKTGMMQELLTKGIGVDGVPHTEFKDSPVGRIPVGWKVKPLTEEIEVKHGFQFRENHFHESGMQVVKIKNLTHGSFVDMKGCSYVPREVFPNYRSFLVEKGDILMALTGGTLGKVSVYDLDFSSLQNYRVGNFYPKDKKMSKRYIFWILQSEFVQKRVEELVNEAAQPNIGKADLENMLIPVPGHCEQLKIAHTLNAIFDRCLGLESKLKRHLAIKKALMQDLLTGKVRVQVDTRELADA
jgi:type I restriction enzyme S subunit